ncbi:MAG: SDR family oxidoreductase [Actinomycetota bacterium]|nr:SDR family oxidoreductase [Actinomycetota bacterium]
MPTRSVVITGASTGIGRACALHLDGKGWHVFAGVRKPEDGVALKSLASKRLTTVMIDVSEKASISQAEAAIRESLEQVGLAALVNNAGITVQGPLEHLPLDELRHQMEVNVIGQLAVTQALLPLIRKANGRIVFMGSVGGRAPSLPFLGPYIASKYAIEAIPESLRLELLSAGIKVSIVEPGTIKTPLWEKGYADVDRIAEWLTPEGRQRYLEPMKRFAEFARKAERRGTPPEKVALKVEHALTSSHPKIHYLVGDAWTRAWVEANLPKPVRDRLLSRLVLGRDP